MSDTSAGVGIRRIDLEAGLLTAYCLIPPSPRAVAVLLHGIPSVAPRDPLDEGYEGLARRFAERSMAALWADLRGVRDAGGFFSIEAWVDDARSLVEAASAVVDDTPIVIVGSSAGGAVALEAAARGAELAAVVCLGTPAAWGSFATDGAEGIRRIERDAGMKVSSGAVAAPDEWASEFDRVTAMSSIEHVDLPVLVVHGTDDDVVPVDHAFLLGRASPRARVEILQAAGHQLRREPRAVELVLDWLEEVLP